MMPGTSPSINDISGEFAFQANTGHLWTLGPGGKGDSGLQMMPGTSPSINNVGQVAFQENTGLLSTWGHSSCGCTAGTGLGMWMCTSPSINERGVVGLPDDTGNV